MQPLKVRNALNFAVANKNIIRSIGVSSTVMEKNIKQTQDLKSWKDIPGPLSLPYLGPLFHYIPGGKVARYNVVQLTEHFYKTYGPIVRVDGYLGAPSTVMLFDPAAVEHVFRSEEAMPIRPGIESLVYYRQRYNKTYDPKRLTGLASDQGENWREFRTKVNPIVMQPRIIKLYADVLEHVANDMIKRLRWVRYDKDTMLKKFNEEMNLWALESISVVALGTRLNGFDPNLPADSPVRKLIQNAHDIFNLAMSLDLTPSPWRLYATPFFKKAMRIYEEHERLTKYFIHQAIQRIEESKKNSKEAPKTEKPVLEKLLDIDVRVAHIMASDMLLAGVDTASNTAIATLYLLANNQEKQKKLREEILSNQSRTYLKACIKESMRMLPVVKGNVRLSTKEYNLLGYKIPKNVLIASSHQYMSNMEEFYPRPDEFIPERWLTSKDNPLYYGKTHRFAMAPFGFGIRMCIGRRIAELEMETLISKIVENFQIDWTSDKPLQIAPTVLNYITPPFYFDFKDL